MVNIDDSLGKGIDKLGGKNLHVAGKHNKIHSIFLEQRDNLAFGGELVVLFNGNKKERNPVELSNGATLRMIRDDAGNIAGQFSASVLQGALSVMILFAFGLLQPFIFFMLAGHIILPAFFWHWADLIQSANR